MPIDSQSLRKLDYGDAAKLSKSGNHQISDSLSINSRALTAKMGIEGNIGESSIGKTKSKVKTNNLHDIVSQSSNSPNLSQMYPNSVSTRIVKNRQILSRMEPPIKIESNSSESIITDFEKLPQPEIRIQVPGARRESIRHQNTHMITRDTIMEKTSQRNLMKGQTQAEKQIDEVLETSSQDYFSTPKDDDEMNT